MLYIFNYPYYYFNVFFLLFIVSGVKSKDMLDILMVSCKQSEAAQLWVNFLTSCFQQICQEEKRPPFKCVVHINIFYVIIDMINYKLIIILIINYKLIDFLIN